MGACASAPRDALPEAREDAGVLASSFRAKAVAAGPSVDPEVGRSVRHDRHKSDSSRDGFDTSDTSGASVAPKPGDASRTDASAKRARRRVSVSSAKARSGGGDDAASFSLPREARAWPAWLSAHAGEALRALGGPRDLASFRRIAQVGQGTYGAVYECVDEARDGRRVALKKVAPSSASAEACAFAAREVLILLKLRHNEHTVRLLDVAVDRRSAREGDTGERRSTDDAPVFLVLEYVEHDIAGLMASTELGSLRLGQVKRLAWQLFTALEQSHGEGILHRDVKGSNVLVDDSGNLKLADWGLAVDGRTERKKGFVFCDRKTETSPERRSGSAGSPRALTPTVVTLWYRPPEILLGATEYDGRVDVWSAGCLLAELINGEPVFPAKTATEQLRAIVAACAPTADAADVAKITRDSRSDRYTTGALAALGIASHRDSGAAESHGTNAERKHDTLTEKFAGFPDEAFDLLRRLLVLDPARRLTATQALAHPFFFAGAAPEPLALSHLESSHEFTTRRRQRSQGAKAGVPAPRRSINQLTRGQTFDPRALSHVISLKAREKVSHAERSPESTPRSSSAARASPDERSDESFDSVLDAAERAADASGSAARASRAPESEDGSASGDEGDETGRRVAV